MKKLYIIISIIFLVNVNYTYAQIVNGGFEDWDNNGIVGWFSSNVTSLWTPVTKSTDAHSGSFAAKGEVVSYAGNPVGALIQSATDAHGFTINQRPKSLTGYYKFSPVNDDRFIVDCFLYKGAIAVGAGAFENPQAVDTYTKFTVNIGYFTNDVPDNCVIQIVTGNSEASEQVNVGTYFLVDDIAFEGDAPTSVESNIKNDISFKLEQNFPNPFNPATEINYQIPVQSHVVLKVFNALGKEVAALVNGEKAAGKYTVSFNGSKLPSGIYFYTLTAGNFISTKKLILMK